MSKLSTGSRRRHSIQSASTISHSLSCSGRIQNQTPRTRQRDARTPQQQNGGGRDPRDHKHENPKLTSKRRYGHYSQSRFGRVREREMGRGVDLKEVDDVGLEERAVAAEEGGDGLHPLAGLLRRLARARAAPRRRRRHREGRSGGRN